MSKLSESLKALINAAHARPNTIPAPRNISSVYNRIATDAVAKKVGLPAWLTASTAVTFTMNSPDSLMELYRVANSNGDEQRVYTAELMREVGLKCIGFNGVPRTINCLGAFVGALPEDVQKELRTRPARRGLSPRNVAERIDQGAALWDSVYAPLTTKLTNKLAQSHPDLPVFIMEAEYGNLFSDPTSVEDANRPNIGRVLTSVAAVACLRAQSGVGPQVVSHVFGLRKAFEDGSAESESAVLGGKWLASDDGSVWLLEQVDKIVAAIGGSTGSTFAPGFDSQPKAKL